MVCYVQDFAKYAFVQSIGHVLHMQLYLLAEVDREPENISNLLGGTLSNKDKPEDTGKRMNPQSIRTHISINIERIGSQHLY